jgi:NADH-quinone oxidoreductase subunit E
MITGIKPEEQPLERSTLRILETIETGPPTEVELTMVEMAMILAPYRGQRGVLMEILHQTQDKFGYLPEVAIREISRATKIPEAEIYGTATFYSFFTFSPKAKNVVKVCQGTACHIKGGWRVQDAVERALGLKAGETTDDNMFSLERVACIGACALAPAMVVNGKVSGELTPKKIADVFERMKEGVQR